MNNPFKVLSKETCRIVIEAPAGFVATMTESAVSLTAKDQGPPNCSLALKLDSKPSIGCVMSPQRKI